MNHDELLCGWMSERSGKHISVRQNWGGDWVVSIEEKTNDYRHAKLFTASLDTIRLIEEQLSEAEWAEYLFFVAKAEVEGTGFSQFRCVRHATAAQCAEALVRALGLEVKDAD